jgi:NAD(P)-dependent dehydrogenase (short-subunit alcohol dehydrogenase family)
MNVKIENSVIFVTGASSGIGEATARAAAAAGARLVLMARRRDRLHALAAELPDALAIDGDVTRKDDIDRAIAGALDTYGRVDVLVNNAGQGLHVPLHEVNPDDFRAILELNLVAPLIFMQAILPVMRRQGAGSIINVSSGTSLMTLPGVGAYAASKAGLNALSDVARLEFADAGISVSTVYPFVTATEFHSSLRAGGGAVGAAGRGPSPQAASEVATVILELIRSGDARADLIPRQFGGTYDGPTLGAP